MTTLVKKKMQFKNFLYPFHTTDVIFQQSNLPSGNMLKGKIYFSGKHKLYGFKTEVSVTPSGQAVDIMVHKPGSISDFVIFQENIEFHNSALTEFGKDTEIVDNIETFTKFPDSWVILMDNGYQGMQCYICAIMPKKKTMAKWRCSTV